MLIKFIVGVVKVCLFPFYRVKLHNVENFNNEKGKCIICCNHISNLDPVMLYIHTKRKINFMAKKELFEIPVIKNIIKKAGAFPVDREKPSLSTIRTSLNILQDGGVLGIFPEGTRVKAFDVNNAKPGVAMIAHKGQSPVIPVFIKGSYKLFSRIDIYFGTPRLYGENIEGRARTEDYTIIGQQMLQDIYSLNKEQ